MASGHVNRIKRPNTWLHRPMLQNVKKALANPEPSTHGTGRTSRAQLRVVVDLATWPGSCPSSEIGPVAEVARSQYAALLLVLKALARRSI